MSLSTRRHRQAIATPLLDLVLDRTAAAAPLYQQIHDAVYSAVLSGALTPDMRLPPERDLATALAVNRTTVMRAYRELAADGVVTARRGHGTVIRTIPAHERGAGATAQRDTAESWLLGLPPFRGNFPGSTPGLLRDLNVLSRRDDLISFASGVPSADLVPIEALQEGLQHALTRRDAVGLQYGPIEGLEGLRVALSARLARRNIAIPPNNIMVLAGATQGLSLIAQALLEPGDEIVVEAPTYLGLLQSFAAAGVRVIGVPIDRDGLRIDLLTAVLRRRTVRLIVVQPTLHNPTGATLSPTRRVQLLALARQYGIPIVEDDAYGDLWSDGPDPQPLKALDRHGVVLHLTTFSKTIAPGLRVGWLAAPTPVIARLTLAKQFADISTNLLGQLTVLSFVESGAYDRHLCTVRSVYAQRLAVMRTALEGVDGVTAWPHTRGGFYLWCRLNGGHARLLAAAAARAGVGIVAGEAFYPPESVEDGGQHIRLCVSGATTEAIVEGVRRLQMALAGLPDRREAIIGQMHSLSPVV